MPNPELKIDVKLNDSDYQRGAKNIQKSLGDMERDFKSLGRDISQLSRSFVLLGASVTGGIGVAFAKASKDIPQINSHLKEVSSSFQVLANNLATAAEPSLKAFVDLVNGSVSVISKFAQENAGLINQIIKYAAVTGVIFTLSLTFGSLLKNIANVISILKTLGLVVGVTTASFVSMTTTIIAAASAIGFLAAKFPSFRSAGFVGLGASIGKGGTLDQFIKNLKSQLASLDQAFKEGIDKPLQRSADVIGKFAEGFRSTLNSLSDNISGFGASFSGSLEKAFSDTIFDSATGKFNDLKSVIIGFSNDVGHALSKLAANEILSRIFGDKEGTRSGIFPGLGAMFGRGKKDKEDSSLPLGARIAPMGYGNRYLQPAQMHAQHAIKKNARQFDDLTDNMKKFGRAKDDVIENLKKFSRQLQSMGKGAGGQAPGADAGASALGGSVDPVNSLNEALGQTMAMVSGIGQGFSAVSQQIIKMGKTYAITQAFMLGVSAAAGAISVAIGTAVAAALTAAYYAPAVLASIMTFGGAAVIGTAAVQGAIAGGPPSGGGGGGFGGGADITSSFGGLEGIPKFASGGIVTRPTLGIIGEAGPEAIVPLKDSSKKGFGGDKNVNINIDTAMLNSPSNMRDFVKMLKEELAR